MPQYPYDTGEDPLIAREDFDDRVDIIPVSDPNATSFAQRMMQQQAALQTSAQAPSFTTFASYIGPFLTTTGVEDVDSILPDPTEIPAYDPISENARLMSGAGVKVYEYQDHDSHLSGTYVFDARPKPSKEPDGQTDCCGSVGTHF